MKTLKKIIELEITGKWEDSLEVALVAPRDTWFMYLDYKAFEGQLYDILNENFIV